MSLVAVIQLPFWPVWLAARGLTAGEIGIVLADAICLKVLQDRRSAQFPAGRESVLAAGS
jgi:hypothetical protein